MNDVASWRDFAADLTTDQAADLGRVGWMSEADKFDLARDMVGQNKLQDKFGNIPAPAGATRISRWVDEGDSISRDFTGTEWPFKTVTVRVVGVQHCDGEITRAVELQPADHADPVMKAAEAKKVAEAMIAACEELVALDEEDGPPFQ